MQKQLVVGDGSKSLTSWPAGMCYLFVVGFSFGTFNVPHTLVIVGEGLTDSVQKSFIWCFVNDCEHIHLKSIFSILL